MHAEHVRLATAIDTLLEAGADRLLCTGDLADGPGDLAAVCRLIDAHDVLCVRGNHDRWLLDERVRHIDHAHHRHELTPVALATLERLPTQRTLATCAGPLLLCHGMLDNDLAKIWPGSERMPAETSAPLDSLIERGGFRLLINGHMHYRVILDFPGLTLINAGTLSPRHRPGVTLLDCAAETITVFEFGADDPAELHATRTLPLFDAARPRWSSSAAFDGATAPAVLYS